jgi:hypothetical protein
MDIPNPSSAGAGSPPDILNKHHTYQDERLTHSERKTQMLLVGGLIFTGVTLPSLIKALKPAAPLTPLAHQLPPLRPPHYDYMHPDAMHQLEMVQPPTVTGAPPNDKQH